MTKSAEGAAFVVVVRGPEHAPVGSSLASRPRCRHDAWGMPPRPPPDVRDENGRLVRELHGVTLVQILEYLVAKIGWEGLASRMTVNCFRIDPSVKSSLVFLRRTPWARTQVEALYVELRTAELRRAKPPAT